LRDVVSNLSVQTNKLYHLGAAIVSRSSLARVNEQQPYTLYEQLAGKLLRQCQARAPRHGFRFKNKLYSLDASTIDLCLSVFPWAKFVPQRGRSNSMSVWITMGYCLPSWPSPMAKAMTLPPLDHFNCPKAVSLSWIVVILTTLGITN
jgi:hypothetical protein